MSESLPNFSVLQPDSAILVDQKVSYFLRNRKFPDKSEPWTISKFQRVVNRIVELKELTTGSESLKTELDELMSQVSDPGVLHEVQSKINDRRRKRKWLKRRQKAIKAEYADQLKQRDMKNFEIDQNLEKLREKLKQERNSAKEKREIKRSLSVLNKRIASIRQKTNKLNPQNPKRRDLEAILEDLKADKESLLNAFLEKFDHERFLERQRNFALFGDYQLDKTEISRETLVDIRRKWDEFIDVESGSSIPASWVSPNPNPNQAWSQYLVSPSEANY